MNDAAGRQPAARGIGYLLSRLLLVVAAVAVPLIALQLVSIADARREAEHRAFASLKARADAVAQHSAQLIAQAEHLMAFLAARKRFRELDPEACRALVDGVADGRGPYRNIGLIDAEGRAVCSSAPSPAGTRFLDFDWFRAGLAAPGFQLSAPMRGRVSGRMVMYLTLPVQGLDGRRAGLIATALDIEPLTALLQPHAADPGAAVGLVRDRRIIVTRLPDADAWIGRAMPPGLMDAPQLDGVPVRVGPGLDGIARASAESALPHYGLTAYAAIPVPAVYAEANRAAAGQLVQAAAAVALGLAAAWLAARRLASSLHSIADTARRLQAGQTALRADATLPGEFGVVATEFNRLLDAGDARAAQLHRSEQHAVRMRRFYEALSSIGRAIARQASAEHLAAESCRGCVEARLADAAWFAAPDAAGRMAPRQQHGDAPPWDDAHERATAGAAAAQVPVRQPCGDGAELVAVPVRVEGAVVGVLLLMCRHPPDRLDDELVALLKVLADEIALGLDLDRHRAARAALATAEAANRAKTAFLSHVSHELRTPLNAVLGFAQLLHARARAQRRDDDAAETGHVLAAGRHLKLLIDELMDVSRIEAGELSVVVGDVDLGRKLHGVAQLSRPLAQQHGVRIEIAPDVPEQGLRLRTDARRLHQVLMNLVSNAVKYNRRGGRVGLAVGCSASELSIEVADDGAGMSPAQLDRLFSAFDRLGREHSGIEGTGLGLVITRRLVRLLGGRLEIDSREGAGTTVTVWLPYVAAQEAPATAPPPPAAAASADPTAGVEGQVLYIEDTPLNALLVQQCFAGSPGIRITVAPTGSEGLRLAAEQLPQLVLLDMQLPDLHGLDVLARLRAGPRTASLRVIALSASAMPEEVEAAIDAGAEAYWTKPVDFAALRAGVAQVLREATAGRRPAG